MCKRGKSENFLNENQDEVEWNEWLVNKINKIDV